MPREHTGAPVELKSNDPCPKCHIGRLAYNGMLNLECCECGYTVGGCFT